VKELPFSKNWSKLSQQMFTTLRKSKKISEGELAKIIIKGIDGSIIARCLLVVKLPLASISSYLLCVDTDSKTREEAIAQIQAFYHNALTPGTNFFIHLFQRLTDSEMIELYEEELIKNAALHILSYQPELLLHIKEKKQ